MPIRTCLGCRATDEQERLVRLVADGAGRVKIDGSHKRILSGRGGYVHATATCVGELVKRGALARALKRKIESVGDGELLRRIEKARGIKA